MQPAGSCIESLLLSRGLEFLEFGLATDSIGILEVLEADLLGDDTILVVTLIVPPLRSGLRKTLVFWAWVEIPMIPRRS